MHVVALLPYYIEIMHRLVQRRVSDTAMAPHSGSLIQSSVAAAVLAPPVLSHPTPHSPVFSAPHMQPQ
jgi:hypothetical protein